MGKKKEKRFWKKIILVSICGLLCGGVGAGTLAAYTYVRQHAGKEAEETGKKQESESISNQENNEAFKQTAENAEERVSSVYDVSVVWDNVIPAIVEIETKSVVSYRFFGREYEQESRGSGTGVIISQAEELFIVTNNHVVDGATEITVSFVDGTAAQAEVKGTDVEGDIAVLAINFSDLSEDTMRNIKIATIGDSTGLSGGEMVIAIGNAAGSGQSLTVGYVSAVDREVEIEGIKMRLIQMDAAINPGNSGGALLNAKGELIGINNAKLVASDVEGIGYAIPISEVVSIVNRMLNREEIDYEESAFLGIVGQDVTETFSELLNIPVGIYISEIEEGSPAKQAGLPLYAVITEVNGITVKTKEQLGEALSYIRGGTQGTVTVQERVNGIYVPKEYAVTFGVRGKDREN
ncbi:MAG: trypsin-like peptidase domain-containing protein [Lachnospiraceae bacterium]|nr:trypsin-like peptidase domain-containing protein [Lachnospiraceae bacterium]